MPDRQENNKSDSSGQKTRPLGFWGRRRKHSPQYSAWALASSMGLSMVLATVMGLLFGYWLDGRLGTRPIFLLVFLFMGIGAGFKNIFVIHKRIERYQASLPSAKNKPQDEEQKPGREK